jgi:hypothetical protein
MRLHVLVEGPSEEALLTRWLARLLPQHRHKVYPHRGKGKIPGDPTRAPDPLHQGLLDQLPAKLRSFGRQLDPKTDRVVVLVDLDDDSSAELGAKLADVLAHCDPAPSAVFSLAIEETEAFYLGDPAAIRGAFPRAKTAKLKDYVPDSIIGAWELFQSVIESPVEAKVEWARRMAEHLGTTTETIQRNRSPSYRQFCAALFVVAGETEMAS